ncbi:hypothetical protein AN964_18340 [Heyndrickxia shackletonii]|uniref:Uncharacterized protein n=1 Tax=Heyndrickxia shackletonii TaxID=157838 RepID=A0A0Q3WZZ6_9BACI|nr:hypothetical protein [Heyndrickxia shackletonii]KQL55275.1 hypothetical protein AN964_18340 [Heyndrickxia shackletonii]NEY98805.1 hypothetical protein [Heyndrickxia shackletonii]
MFNRRTIEDLSYKETVDKIVELNKHIRSFWSNAHGWAPIDAADLLSKSRLDWLVSLSYSLYKWEINPQNEAEYGDLILAWANLGTLVEGSMKFFLSVFYEDYKNDINAMKRRGQQVDPDGAMFDGLRTFFEKSVWIDTERQDKNDWLKEIQAKRNAIHAYKDREIDDFNTFRNQVKKYLSFLMDLLGRVPYPDYQYGPDLFIR